MTDEAIQEALGGQCPAAARATPKIIDAVAAVARGESFDMTVTAQGAAITNLGGAARRMGHAVVAGDPRADGFHATPPRLVIAAPCAVTVMSNDSPRATAATASMIFT